MAEALDNLNFIRLFWELLVGRASTRLEIDQHSLLENATDACFVTDCKGLFDAVNRSQSAGLGLSENEQPLKHYPSGKFAQAQICT